MQGFDIESPDLRHPNPHQHRCLSPIDIGITFFMGTFLISLGDVLGGSMVWLDHSGLKVDLATLEECVIVGGIVAITSFLALLSLEFYRVFITGKSVDENLAELIPMTDICCDRQVGTPRFGDL